MAVAQRGEGLDLPALVVQPAHQEGSGRQLEARQGLVAQRVALFLLLVQPLLVHLAQTPQNLPLGLERLGLPWALRERLAPQPLRLRHRLVRQRRRWASLRLVHLRLLRLLLGLALLLVDSVLLRLGLGQLRPVRLRQQQGLAHRLPALERLLLASERLHLALVRRLARPRVRSVHRRQRRGSLRGLVLRR